MNNTLIRFVEDEILRGMATISSEEDLLLSGLVDSIGVMRLVAFIEETFEIQVPPEDVTIESFSTVDAISSYVAGRQQTHG